MENKDKQKNKIEIENKEITCENVWRNVEGYFNDKYFSVSQNKTYDTNCGVTDENLEFLDDCDSDLTDEDKEEIQEYIESEVEW